MDRERLLDSLVKKFNRENYERLGSTVMVDQEKQPLQKRSVSDWTSQKLTF